MTYRTHPSQMLVEVRREKKLRKKKRKIGSRFGDLRKTKPAEIKRLMLKMQSGGKVQPPPQLHLGYRKPDKSHLRPVENVPRDIVELGMDAEKPYTGGFWTSTYDPKSRSSNWTQDEYGRSWTRGSQRKAYLLYPRVVRVFSIDGVTDLQRALQIYPLPGSDGRSIDFEAMSEDYDGLHVTKKGERLVSVSDPVSLPGWLTESTLWFRWVFTKVEEIEL